MEAIDPTLLENGIAIVGLSARLPGAKNVDEFWSNLRNGVESLNRLSEEELLNNGVSPQALRDPNYIPVSGGLQDVEMFDAGYFGFSPKDAAITDPQHRHFLECAVEAFENAGHSTHRFDGAIGVFAGCGMNSYFINNLLTNPEMVRTVGPFLLRHTGNDRDFLPTTISYKLDLRGPSMAIQTACSTSLVAIHTACQSLLAGECEMAVAGGSTILVPNGQGYFYRENEPVSPDGHCRAFDADSAGTVLTSGTGVVVLRRLEDALEDGDTIQAVIRGSAVNNDGANKIGYMAPSVEGHASAVAEALAVADVSADTISYLEAHGTGTHLGDPIEISALSQAFRASTEKTQFCRIGSVKSNIGHLDTAAGVASLIKVVRSMQAQEMAPTLHFHNANPEIDFESSPFLVNAELRKWEKGSTPRRAGVSSLGIGGTNAHIVLEEAPQLHPTDPPIRKIQVLPLSAKSRGALDAAAENLAAWMDDHEGGDLADVAFTLQEGRDFWEHRCVVSASSVGEVSTALRNKDKLKYFNNKSDKPASSVAFMFSGAGAQYPNMAKGLYETESVFREAMDTCLTHLKGMIDYDLKAIMYPAPDAEQKSEAELQMPSRLCPAVVITEWSLAQLWKSRGVEPSGMIGHSLGEYVAACISGVLSLQDMLHLVVLRGNLIERLSGGAMLSLPLSETEARELIGDRLDLAAINSPGLCVVSGPLSEVQNLTVRLEQLEIESRLVPVDAAGHSRHLDPILDEFEQGVSQVTLSPPEIPYISNVTGTWATAEDVTQPNYWVRHLRGTVRFSEGLEELLQSEDRVLLEVGPGQTLCTFARQQTNKPIGIVPSLRRYLDEISDDEFILGSFGKLWASGYPVSWQELRGKDERRRRIALPTYPFEHKPYWIEPGVEANLSLMAEKVITRKDDFGSWFQQICWKEVPVGGADVERVAENWLVFMDDTGVGVQIVQELLAAGHHVSTVTPADAFAKLGENNFALAPELGRVGYEQLITALAEAERIPDRIAHLWSLTLDESFRPGSSFLDQNQENGFYSLLFLMQALGDVGESVVEINVITNGMTAIDTSERILYPEKATMLGPVRVIPREYPETICRCIDISLPVAKSKGLAAWVGLEGPYVNETDAKELAKHIITELRCPPTTSLVAWRGSKRFEEFLAPQTSAIEGSDSLSFRQNGVYLVTGGLGGIGFALAKEIAKKHRARMVLVGRSEFPNEEDWDTWLTDHGENDGTAQKIREIRQIRESGGDVLPVAADVTDEEQMRNVIAIAHDKFGPIKGILHAAASVSDGILHNKTKDGAEQTFATKLYGTLVLDRIAEDIPLDFLLLFSSTSAIVGLPGQVDYAGANAFLNAFAERRNKNGKRTIALDWGIWNDVGGAMELAKQIRGEVQTSGYERPTGHPLLGMCTQNGPELWRWESSWAAADLWVLNEHRNAEQIALLPGTGYLEIAKAAFADALSEAQCQIENVSFLTPLAVSDDTIHDILIELTREHSGYRLTVFSRRSGSEHASMQLRKISDAPETVDIQGLFASCQSDRRTAEPGTTLPSSQEAQLGFGPRWSCLRSIGFGTHLACAELELDPQFISDFEQFSLHPGLLDIATSFGIPLVDGWKSGKAIYVPLAYGAIRVFAPLQEHVFARIVSSQENSFSKDVATFSVTILDSTGSILMDIENYQMRKLDLNSGFGSLEMGESSDSQHEPTAMESLFLETFDNGILLEEGRQALEKSLAEFSGGVTVISPISIEDWQQRVKAGCVAGTEYTGITFARPDLDNEYEAPRDDIEKELVAIWQEFLGVDQIGIHDDFFDLGGHSLIAVRVFAKIKKRWGVDWPISKLFDAPCIGQFGDLLRSEIGPGEEASGDVAIDAPQNHRFLVKMNRATSDQRKPLFLVAGMFGNVLNLRHLATRLGDDQPVYALQAKGLYGEDEPHLNFVDAARDYIAEMREIQPQGPYMIGGFSGGGVTAFEIAHQLLEAGDDISALVMLDSIPPHPAWPETTFTDRVQIQLQRLNSEVFRDPITWIKGRIRWELEKRTMQERKAERTPAEFRSDLIEAAFRTSLSVYKMRVLPRKISLFRPPLDDTFKLGNGRCANADGLLMEDLNWWNPWTTEGVDVKLVPGNHDSMVLEPNVRVLAEQVRIVLDEAHLESAEILEVGSQATQPTLTSKITEQGVRYAS